VLLLVALGLAVYPIIKAWKSHGPTENKARVDVDD
jgi:hypothetical protein